MDISVEALAQAREKAVEEGLGALDYALADLDSLHLPSNHYDAVFFHQALHHVRELEACLQVVRRSLRPGGILYLDEYVGPSRGEWRASLMREIRSAFRDVPAAGRRVRRVGLPVDWRDPSEAIRSSEIERAVAGLFTSLARRPYGGNLLAPLLPNLSLDALPDEAHQSVVARLAAREDQLMATGQPSFYIVAVFRKAP